MKKYSYLILGANVGSAIATWLASQDDTNAVVLADRDHAVALEATTRLPGDMYPAKVDTETMSGRTLCRLFEPYDVVISAVPARCSPKLVRCAIVSGTHFCDLGGVTEVTLQIRRLRDDVKENRASIVTDNGLMPGLGNIIADRLLDKMNGATDICVTIRAGGIPLKPVEPLNYGRMFSPEGLRHLYRNHSPVLINGKIEHQPPFWEYRHVQVPTLQKLNPRFPYIESFVTGGAGMAPWTFQKRGVKHFREDTLRWPGFVSNVSQMTPSTLERHLEPVDAEHPDIMYLDVSVVDENSFPDDALTFELLHHFDHETGLTAMAQTTGYPTAVIAQMLAQGKLPPGIWTPEEVLRAGDLTDTYLGQVDEALGSHE